MSNIYETYFFVQYLIILLSYAIQMFNLMMVAESNMYRLIKSIVYMCAILMQFVICNCYLAQELSNNVRNNLN